MLSFTFYVTNLSITNLSITNLSYQNQYVMYLSIQIRLAVRCATRITTLQSGCSKGRMYKCYSNALRIFTVNLLPPNFTVSSWHGGMNLFGFTEIWAAHINPPAPFLAWLDVAQFPAGLCLPAGKLRFERWKNCLVFKSLDWGASGLK